MIGSSLLEALTEVIPIEDPRTDLAGEG